MMREEGLAGSSSDAAAAFFIFESKAEYTHASPYANPVAYWSTSFLPSFLPPSF